MEDQNMGHFSVEIMRLPGQLSVEINTPTSKRTMSLVADLPHRLTTAIREH